MIPRHAPPFGLSGLVATCCWNGSVGQEALERRCADEFQVGEAVLLPSARTGIWLALRAAASSVKSAVGPAFVCGVVHQAMQLSGLPIRLLDCATGGYLMNAAELCRHAEPPAALVLCELYGLRYPPGAEIPAGMRVWDMAMCVPCAADLHRLERGDAAVLSFGLGKCLYAGWGGVLLTHDPALAARVRGYRDELVAEETRRVRFRHSLNVFASAVLHNRLLYGAGRAMADFRNRPRARSSGSRPIAASPPVVSSAKLSSEWSEPMTPLNRQLALSNIRKLAESRELRRREAEEYYRLLSSTGLARGIGEGTLPESHFPIRVPAAMRSELRRHLARCGIDTATYFSFPGHLKREDYPQAAEAADEVVLLPLGRCIRVAEIARVVECVKEGLRRLEPS